MNGLSTNASIWPSSLKEIERTFLVNFYIPFKFKRKDKAQTTQYV